MIPEATENQPESRTGIRPRLAGRPIRVPKHLLWWCAQRTRTDLFRWRASCRQARKGHPDALEWPSPASGITIKHFETEALMPSSIRPDDKSATNWRPVPQETGQPSLPCMDLRRVNCMSVSGPPVIRSLESTRGGLECQEVLAHRPWHD